jgi:hypothetical protein
MPVLVKAERKQLQIRKKQQSNYELRIRNIGIKEYDNDKANYFF